jgi:hypothetical protein
LTNFQGRIWQFQDLWHLPGCKKQGHTYSSDGVKKGRKRRRKRIFMHADTPNQEAGKGFEKKPYY